MKEQSIDPRRHIDITDKAQVNHFLRCWGCSQENIQEAILAVRTTEISKIHAHLFGSDSRSRMGFDF